MITGNCFARNEIFKNVHSSFGESRYCLLTLRLGNLFSQSNNLTVYLTRSVSTC